MNLDLSGTPIPVALITDPFAKCFAQAAQTGDVPTLNGAQNPMDVLSAATPLGLGFTVVIMNSLSTPLRLVETYIPDPTKQLMAGAKVTQAGYPLAPAPAGSGRDTDAHVIPGTCECPSPKKHNWIKNGCDPTLMGGLGVYSFTPADFTGASDYWGGGQSGRLVQLAMSFSAADDGSGPLVAFAVRLALDPPAPWSNQVHGPLSVHSSCTADLNAGYAGLSDFYGRTVGYAMDDGSQTTSYNSPDIGKVMTVWATLSTKRPSDRLSGWTLTVWVRDNSSTLGV